MKRFLTIALACLLLMGSALPISAAEPDSSVTLNVYNWGEYIDPTVNDLFTEETGIKVNYKNFTDNESMYAVLDSGAAIYDVIVPSDYMIGKLINEGKLAKLDFTNIPNMSQINPSLLNPSYDPQNEYSVPYTWGTVGIFYNTKYVDEADLQLGWDLLWSEKYSGRIFTFDNPRDAFGIALLKCGFSLNTLDLNEWNTAYDALRAQKPVLHQYVMDQVYDKMINEEAWIAPYYAGDGIVMMDEEEGNPAIDFFVPTTGTNLFVDALCVPVDSPHKREAEEYINFLCRTDIALLNAEYIGYSTPQEEARAQLDPEIGENENFYPPESVLQKAEMYITLPETVGAHMDTLWMKLKLADPAWSVFTVLVGIAAVVCFSLYVVRRIRYYRKKR
ncbi:MAG: spermidine/putrescine ABC transporter substrate-binding protein [Clostridia bacterium]|nr:spermidine/putrescine ABC transporter substrate-binding protein [Clostridia bacterium]